MSSGKKAAGTDAASVATAAAAALAAHFNGFSQLDLSSASASPLLLVAAVAAAQQQQRQLLQLKQQQEQQQATKAVQEEKPLPGSADRTHASTPSSVHSLVWAGRSSPTPAKEQQLSPASQQQTGLHKIRKLKLYSVDEKIDIIDYAKVIGNRAAGREFNVAESSIREWRKNEERLRAQSERWSNGAQRIEGQFPELINELDSRLVEFIDNTPDVDWYAIRDKAREHWPDVVKGVEVEENEKEVNITMGWVTRFMKRNEHRVPRIAPPVIATANAAGTHNGSVTMVRKASPFGIESSSTTAEKTTASSHSQVGSLPTSPSSSPSPALLVQQSTVAATPSRRKCAQPRRATDATLVLTPDKDKPQHDFGTNQTAEKQKQQQQPSTEPSRDDEDPPPAKRSKHDENDNQSLLDAIIKVC